MQKFKRTDYERYSSLDFPALKQSIAITNLMAAPEMNPDQKVANMPKPDVMMRAVVAYVDLCIDAVAELNDAVAKAAVDKYLSVEGRAAAVARYKDAAINTFESALKLAKDDEAEVVAARAELYAPPTLAADDIRGELRDQEVRRRYHSLSPGPRAALLNQSAEGTRAVLAAVLRDPIDTPEKKMAADMWRASIATMRPDAVALLEMQEGVIAWMKQSLRTLGAVLDACTDYGSRREARKRGLVIEPPAGEASKETDAPASKGTDAPAATVQ